MSETTTNPDNRRMRPMRRLAARTLPAANLIVYECPAGRSTNIETMVFCNTHSAKVTLRVFHLIPGESAGTTNALFYELDCAGYTSTVVEFPVHMGAGDRIVCRAGTASHICATLYGVESGV